jgi:hypothetical protein
VEERTRQDFADFVAARSAELLRLAYVLTGDRHAAEDLLQTERRDHWHTLTRVLTRDSPGRGGPVAVTC